MWRQRGFRTWREKMEFPIKTGVASTHGHVIMT